MRQSSTANHSQLAVVLLVVAGDDDNDEDNERFVFADQIRIKNWLCECECVCMCFECVILPPQYECYAYKMDFCST